MKNEIKIDVTDLKADERVELATLLYKAGYTIRSSRRKIQGNKYNYYIVYSKGGASDGM